MEERGGEEEEEEEEEEERDRWNKVGWSDGGSRKTGGLKIFSRGVIEFLPFFPFECASHGEKDVVEDGSYARSLPLA